MKPIVFLLMTAIPVNASECTSIENDLDRLACYDIESGLTEKTTASPPVGEWNIRSKTSEFKDTTDVFVNVRSEKPVSCRSYGDAKDVALIMRCSENVTSLYLSTDCHVASGHSGYGNVDYRIDKNPAKKRGFEASSSNSALGLWSGRTAIPFIKEMLGGKKMIVRFMPYAQNSVTASFNISGIDDAIKSLRKECGW